MATSYTGLRVQDTYNAIIKIGDNSNLSGTAKLLSDGLGNDSPLYLSGTRLGIGISPAYQFHTSGNAKIGGNLIISGDLTVNGTTTIIDSTIIAIGDNMIEMAKDNVANTKDIGWYGTIVESGTKYAGMAYDASTGVTAPKFNLGLGTVEPGNTFATTITGTLIANLEGNVTGTVSSLSNHDTNDLVEGSVNLYYTNARADARVNLQTGANLDLSSKDTDDLSEGTTNLYFTTARARASFSAGDGITITNGVIASEGDAEVAKRIEVTVKNVSGGSLAKGVVVHAAPTATPPSGNVIEVVAADANVAANMPAIGVLNETIADEAEGEAVMFGAVTGIDTSSFTAGVDLYVSETAGEFTQTKPTAFTSQVQKIAIVLKVHASNGSIKVFGAGRSNDVPNRVDRDMNFTDDSELTFGDSSDLKIYHTTNNIVRINSGDLIFNSFVTDGDIKFQLDNGSGSLTEYMRLDGGTTNIVFSKPISGTTGSFSGLVTGIAPTSDLNFATKKYVDDNIPTITTPALSAVLAAGNTSGSNDLLIADDQKLLLGDDSDFEIFKFGTGDNFIRSNTGHLYLQIEEDDHDMFFQGDDGSGGKTTYFFMDGSEKRTKFLQNLEVVDNNKLILGSNDNSYLKWDSTASQLFISGESKFLNDLYVVETITSTKDGIALQMDGGASAEGIRMTVDSSSTYPTFLRSTNPASGESSPWIYKEAVSAWGIWHNNPTNSFDFTRSTTTGIEQNVGGETNTVMIRLNNTDGSGTFVGNISGAAISGTTGTFSSIANATTDTDKFLVSDSGVIKYRTGAEVASDISATLDGQYVKYNGTVQTTTAKVMVKLKNTVTDAGGYGEIHILNDNDDKIIVGSIGSGYTGVDWTGATYVYNTGTSRKMYIKSQDQLRFFTGGTSITANTALVLDTSQNATFTGDINISGDQLTFTNDDASAYIRGADALLIQSDYNGGENKPIYLQPSAVTELKIATGLSTFTGNVVVGGTTIDAAGSVSFKNNGFIRSVLASGSADSTLINGISGVSNGFQLINDASNNQSYIFHNGGTASLKIDTNGNVGVNDSSPDYKLTVGKTSIAAPAFMVSGAYYGGPRIQTYGLDADSNAWMGLGTDMSGGAYEHNIYFSDYNGNGRLSIGTYNGTTYSEKMCVLRNGKVGIGNSQPDHQLTVKATNCIIDAQSTADSQTIGFRAGYLNNADLCGFFRYTTADAQLYIDNNFTGNNGVYSDINFRNKANGGTSLINRMKIKGSSGYVGIATDNPLHNLQIGTAATNGSYSMMIEGNFGNTALASNPRLNLIDTNFGITAGKYGSGASDDAIGIFAYQGAGRGILFAHTTAGSGTTLQNMRHDMFIDGGTGRVGINTVDPSAQLDVYQGNIRRSGITSGGYLEIGDLPGYAANAYQSLTSGGTIHFSNNGKYCAYLEGANTYFGILNSATQTKVFLNTSGNSYITGGNLGVGVSTPDTPLAVYQTGDVWHTKIGNDSGQIRFGGQTGSGAVIQSRTNSGTARDLYIQRDGGNVGININDAKTKLHIGPLSGGNGTAQERLRLSGDYYATGSGALLRFTNQHNSGTNPNSGEYNLGGIIAYDFRSDWGGALALQTAPNTASGGTLVSRLIIEPEGNITIPEIVSIGSTTRYNGTKLNVDGNRMGVRTSNSGWGQLYVANPNDAEVGITFGAGGTGRPGGTSTYTRQWIMGLSPFGTGTNKFSITNKTLQGNPALTIIENTGAIGLRKVSPSYQLDVTGTIRASSDVIAFSDKRVKENIVTIDSALNKVTKLRGVTYTRKDTDDKSTKLGVIAQEVLEVLPEIVEKDDKGMYSVAYGNMAGVFIEAIKELKAEVDSLKQEIKELKK